LEQVLKAFGYPKQLALPAWVISRYLVDSLETLSIVAANANYWRGIERRNKGREVTEAE
jgi:hypothetical protein